MGRRKKQSDELAGLIGGILLLGVAALVIEHPAYLSVLFIVVVAAVMLAALQHSRAKRVLLEKVNAAVNLHIDALSRRRAQLVQPDAYGVPQLEKWLKEIDYFIQRQISPHLASGQAKALERHRSSVVTSIEWKVVSASTAQSPFARFSDDFSAAEFEVYCAQILREHGWDASVTKRSRDQGVDVVASRDGIRVVIQCKLYTGPVGNKAVQEVSAGRAHERAHFGVVVSNSRYTSSAESLAKTNRVLLLHHRDLPNLQGIIERWATSPAA